MALVVQHAAGSAAVFELPHGVAIPESLRAYPQEPPEVVFLGRPDVKKGIENLIRAMAVVDRRYRVHIYGEGSPRYTASLRGLVDEASLSERLLFHGHGDGPNNLAAFQAADICVVPSFTENFCLVVAEALAHGVPVIASTGDPWAQLEEKGCGYWVDNCPESSAAATERAMQQDVAAMGLAGRQ